MGNCNFKTNTDTSVPTLQKTNFQLEYAIGRGGFGKVWRCYYKKDKQSYAVKEMAKARIISKKSVASVMKELYYLEII